MSDREGSASVELENLQVGRESEFVGRESELDVDHENDSEFVRRRRETRRLQAQQQMDGCGSCCYTCWMCIFCPCIRTFRGGRGRAHVGTMGDDWQAQSGLGTIIEENGGGGGDLEDGSEMGAQVGDAGDIRERPSYNPQGADQGLLWRLFNRGNRRERIQEAMGQGYTCVTDDRPYMRYNDGVCQAEGQNPPRQEANALGATHPYGTNYCTAYGWECDQRHDVHDTHTRLMPHERRQGLLDADSTVALIASFFAADAISSLDGFNFAFPDWTAGECPGLCDPDMTQFNATTWFKEIALYDVSTECPNAEADYRDRYEYYSVVLSAVAISGLLAAISNANVMFTANMLLYNKDEKYIDKRLIDNFDLWWRTTFLCRFVFSRMSFLICMIGYALALYYHPNYICFDDKFNTAVTYSRLMFLGGAGVIAVNYVVMRSFQCFQNAATHKCCITIFCCTWIECLVECQCFDSCECCICNCLRTFWPQFCYDVCGSEDVTCCEGADDEHPGRAQHHASDERNCCETLFGACTCCDGLADKRLAKRSSVM